MRKVWNDLQPPLTWMDVERSETPFWSSKVPTNLPSIDTILDIRFEQLCAKADYANYCDEHNILDNITVYFNTFDIFFMWGYIKRKEPSKAWRIDGITIPDGY